MARQFPLDFEFKTNHRFDDFFAGNNLEIVDHLKRCASGDGEQFIYLYGKAGCGKSHLLQAVCHFAHNRELRPFYFDLAAKLDVPLMLNGLDECGIVCLDNVEHIFGNSAWEHAFFNFFNEHRSLNHQLVVSASCSPAMLPVQLPDLKTRMNWGLTLKIKALSDHDQVAALIFKANHLGFEISPQTGRFLVNHFDSSPLSLWTLLEKLNLESLAAKRKLTVPFLKTILEKATDDG